MMAKRLSMRPFGAILCGAVALWISAGALALTSAESGTARVGVLPSFWWLLGALTAAVLTAVILRPGRQQSLALWLSVVVLLPWLPIPVPAAALIWAGPLRIWVWATVLVLVAASAIARSLRDGRLAIVADSRRAPRLAALAATLVYLGAAWSISPRLPGGDEPHYLVITQSLLLDHDLQIENNHTRGDYHAFFAAPLRPDFLRRGVNDEIYSIHAPGLPAAVAPAFAIFGYPGVLGFLALVSGCATAMVWRAVWAVTGDAAASWFGWAAVALSVPFVFHAFTAYPDGLAAVLVMAGVLTVVLGPEASRRRLVATGIALALLPWLHTRFAVTAASLGIVLAARQLSTADGIRRIVAFAAIPALSAAAWLAFFYVIYGTPNPTAPYGDLIQSALGNVPRGLTGLLLDQQFGVLPNAPVYLCAIVGFGTLARRAPRLTMELIAIAGPYAVASSAYYMWWGGFSAPGRFLVSILLPMAIPMGVWFSARGPAARILALGGLLVSALITGSIAMVDRGALLYNIRDGASRFLLWLSPLLNLPAGFPSLFQAGPASAVERSLVWLLGLAAVAAVGAFCARRGASAVAIVFSTGLAACVAGMAALTLVWSRTDPQPLTPQRAGPAFLRVIDPGAGQVDIRYKPLKRMSLADLLPLIPIASPPPAVGPHDDLLASVLRPPAGIYVIEATVGEGAGYLSASVDRGHGPLWAWDLARVAGPWRQTISLAVPVSTLRLDADTLTRSAIRELSIRAERVPGSDERITNREARRAAHYGSAVVYLLDGFAFMERGGTWVSGNRSAEFAVAPDSGRTVHLLLRNSGVDNIVTVKSNDASQTLMLKPHEERLLDLSVEAGQTGVLVHVTSAAGARPSDVDPGSQDRRLLGVWIETR